MYLKKNGGYNMKKLVSDLFAAIILMVTVLSMNATCIFIFHQDKIPGEAKRLRRF